MIRRWRYRHGVTLHSRDRAYEASLTLQPGACIPVPTRQQPALFHVPNNALANELTKELYVKGIAMRQRDEEELDDNAFIFPCHRGLN